MAVLGTGNNPPDSCILKTNNRSSAVFRSGFTLQLDVLCLGALLISDLLVLDLQMVINMQYHSVHLSKGEIKQAFTFRAKIKMKPRQQRQHYRCVDMSSHYWSIYAVKITPKMFLCVASRTNKQSGVSPFGCLCINILNKMRFISWFPFWNSTVLQRQ